MVGVGLCVHSACQRAGTLRVEGKQEITESAPLDPENLKPEAVSLFGKPLHAPALDAEVRAKREHELEDATVEYDRDPHDADAIIWLGRRQAYLGRFQDAINTFSNGLALDPDNPKLLRHRGHRYVTTRQFGRALADLVRAAALIENQPDETEPDGQPNKQNIPTGTLHTNIYYHLGLVRYLMGDYSGASEAYRKCLGASRNDDMRIAAAYWQYLTLRRLNQPAYAAQLLAAISLDMNIIENSSYHRLLLMFKGELQPDQLSPTASDGQPIDIDAATLGYGTGAWRLLNGDESKATDEFRRVVENTNWAAFGHIAAEVELATPRD